MKLTVSLDHDSILDLHDIRARTREQNRTLLRRLLRAEALRMGGAPPLVREYREEYVSSCKDESK